MAQMALFKEHSEKKINIREELSSSPRMMSPARQV